MVEKLACEHWRPMLNNSSAVLEVDVGNSFCKWRVRAGEAILCSGKAKTGELDTLFATAVGVGLPISVSH